MSVALRAVATNENGAWRELRQAEGVGPEARKNDVLGICSLRPVRALMKLVGLSVSPYGVASVDEYPHGRQQLRHLLPISLRL